MKTLLLPYSTNKKPYWSAIDIYNSGFYEQSLYIKLEDHNGNLKACLTYILDPHEHKIITSENLNTFCPNRFSLLIECADSIYITPFLWYNPTPDISTFSYLPIHTLQNFKDSIRPGKNIPVSWGSNNNLTHPFWIYAGNNNCSYILEKYKLALEIIFRSMYWDFPDRKARRIEIGDCCPSNLTLNCQGHPDNSHAGGKSMDLNYYTFANTNTTQYQAEGFEKVKIWSDNGDLLENVFDWERNWELWKRIKQVFPEMKVRVDKRIADYIHAKTGQDVYQIVTPDNPGQWNHHLHAHVSLGNTINYNAVI